jgi:hypothetical protein
VSEGGQQPRIFKDEGYKTQTRHDAGFVSSKACYYSGMSLCKVTGCDFFRILILIISTTTENAMAK